MELKRSRRRRPRLRPGADRARAARARRRAGDDEPVDRAGPLTRGRRSTTPCPSPPFLGCTGREGHARSTRSPSTSTRRRCSATSGSSGPSRARATTSSRPASGRMLREQLARGQGHRRARAPGRVRLLAGQRRRRRPGRVDRRGAHDRALPRSTSPASGSSRGCASPTSSGRSARARPTTPPSTSSRWAAPCPRPPAELFAENRYQEYLLLHGLGVEMAEALAELWHRRIREEWGFADRGRPDARSACSASSTAAGATPGATPPAPTWRTTPPWPSCSAPSGSASRSSEETGWQYQPEQTTSAIICHHPRAKYFVAR